MTDTTPAPDTRTKTAVPARTRIDGYWHANSKRSLQFD
jgi:hypothetical protein